MQVSRLICKMKEESTGDVESITGKQLQQKIALLPQSRLARAMDVLAMIWNGVKGSLELPTTVPKFASPATPILLPNWHRVKLALLKSIPTGTFIDVQFYACNVIGNNLPLDLRPLFTSSVVVEEWGPTITMRK
jgi:hypothetical protein